MSARALYVTLRVPDPAAITARAALLEMGCAGLEALERGRIWCELPEDPEFDNSGGDWFNPNKERGVAWDDRQSPAVRAAADRECWVLVRDRGSRPEAAILRSLAEHGARAPQELLTAELWRLVFSAAEPNPGTAAVKGAAVGHAREGLLVNPHSQAHRVCRPTPDTLRLRALLRELREEAS